MFLLLQLKPHAADCKSLAVAVINIHLGHGDNDGFGWESVFENSLSSPLSEKNVISSSVCIRSC